MAAAETTRGSNQNLRVPDPNPYLLQPDDDIFKSNVSQAEYSHKHRLLFEDLRRTELKRRRRLGEPTYNVQTRRFQSFKPIEELSSKDARNVLTKTLSYRIDIPEKSNSISEIESAELHLQIIPTSCQNERRITLKVAQEEKLVHVDPCQPRWETLEVYPIPSSLEKISISCIDCVKADATFSAPYLNIVTKTTLRKRSPRRVGKKGRKPCRLSPLVVDFRELPSFKAVTSPRTADIGRCRGSCVADYKPQSQHAFFRYDLARIGKGPLPCCAASKFKNLEYLMPNKNKLERFVWQDAIATDCTCH